MVSVLQLPFNGMVERWNSTSQTQGMAQIREVGGFVNRTVTVLFTKPNIVLVASLPFKAYGHFSVSLEWYQLKPGSCEAGGLVKAVRLLHI